MNFESQSNSVATYQDASFPPPVASLPLPDCPKTYGMKQLIPCSAQRSCFQPVFHSSKALRPSASVPGSPYPLPSLTSAPTSSSHTIPPRRSIHTAEPQYPAPQERFQIAPNRFLTPEASAHYRIPNPISFSGPSRVKGVVFFSHPNLLEMKPPLSSRYLHCIPTKINSN